MSLTFDPLPFSAWTGLGGVPPLPAFLGGVVGPGLGGVVGPGLVGLWGCRLDGLGTPYPPLVIVSKIFVCVIAFGILLSFLSFVIHSLSSGMTSDISLPITGCCASLCVLRSGLGGKG